MEIGSDEHKRAFIEGQRREIQERIWKLEVARAQQAEIAQQLTGEHQALQAQLDAKTFPSANDGKRALKAKEQLIEDVGTKLAEIHRAITMQEADRHALELYAKEPTPQA